MRITTIMLMASFLFFNKLHEITGFKVFESLTLFFAKPLAKRFVRFAINKFEEN